MVIHFKVSYPLHLYKFIKNYYYVPDLAEHALYVAVKQHDIRPPISKLTTLYPRNLLVLVMEMWETDPQLRPSMNHVLERLAAYLL
jgi:hypothetical protein